jgi:hypothetical protein
VGDFYKKHQMDLTKPQNAIGRGQLMEKIVFAKEHISNSNEIF